MSIVSIPCAMPVYCEMCGRQEHCTLPTWHANACRSKHDSDGFNFSTDYIYDARWPNNNKLTFTSIPAPTQVYLIGSLRNPNIPDIAGTMREAGIEVFDDWYAAGPEADDAWRDYEKIRGHSFTEALNGYAAKHVYEFDKNHLDTSRAAVLVAPAGKSAHLELGYMIGRGKPGYVLIDSPDRWDVMYLLASGVYDDLDKLIKVLK